MIYQTIAVKKELNIKEYFINIIGFFIKSLVMFAVVMSIKLLPVSSIIRIIIQVLSGMMVYGLLNIKYIMNIVNIKRTRKKICFKIMIKSLSFLVVNNSI